MASQRHWMTGFAGLAGALLGFAGDGAAGTFTFQVENDIIADTDRHYTNGTRVSYVSKGLRDDLPWARDILDALYRPVESTLDQKRDRPPPDVRLGIAFGQSIFTPDNIRAFELVEDERPYAGWLYAGISLHVKAEQTLFDYRFDVLDTLELDVGIVGPWAQAEDTQKFVHDIINDQQPKGWDNQLDNEPGLALVIERKWRTRPLDLVLGQMDAIPSMAISLGNVDTSGSAGFLVRFGRNLDVDFGPPLIRPNLTGVPYIENQTPFGWYVFAGAGGRVVGHTIFLDGNTVSDSHSVDKERLVGDFQAGVALVLYDVRLTFTHVWRTQEFEQQDEPDRYGGVSLSWHF